MDASKKEILDIQELVKKYPHRWVAAKVLERDTESGQPVKFQVVTSNADIYSARTGLDKGEHCILYTGSIPEEQYVLMY